MGKNTKAIVARLTNGQGVTFLPSGKKVFVKGFIVIRGLDNEGEVCPIQDYHEYTYPSSIYIEDNELFVDVTQSVANTEFSVNGKHDLSSAVKRYEKAIDEKLHDGDTSDDDSSRIINYGWVR